jgi:heme-degrading monooxygenase HmoA
VSPGVVGFFRLRLMFVFLSHLTGPDDDQKSLEGYERSRLVDTFSRFLYPQLLKPQAGDATFAFPTAWDSRASFARYMRSEEHAIPRSREAGPKDTARIRASV